MSQKFKVTIGIRGYRSVYRKNLTRPQAKKLIKGLTKDRAPGGYSRWVNPRIAKDIKHKY